MLTRQPAGGRTGGRSGFQTPFAVAAANNAITRPPGIRPINHGRPRVGNFPITRDLRAITRAAVSGPFEQCSHVFLGALSSSETVLARIRAHTHTRGRTITMINDKWRGPGTAATFPGTPARSLRARPLRHIRARSDYLWRFLPVARFSTLPRHVCVRTRLRGAPETRRRPFRYRRNSPGPRTRCRHGRTGFFSPGQIRPSPLSRIDRPDHISVVIDPKRSPSASHSHNPRTVLLPGHRPLPATARLRLVPRFSRLHSTCSSTRL